MIVGTLHGSVYSYEKPLPVGIPFIIEGEEYEEKPAFDLSGYDSSTMVASSIAASRAKAVSVYDPIAHSCVLYVKTRGYNTSNRDAGDFIPNSQQARHGSIAIFDYGNIQHIGIVEETYLGSFKMSESNYYEGEYSTRIIQFNDPALKDS